MDIRTFRRGKILWRSLKWLKRKFHTRTGLHSLLASSSLSTLCCWHCLSSSSVTIIVRLATFVTKTPPWLILYLNVAIFELHAPTQFLCIYLCKPAPARASGASEAYECTMCVTASHSIPVYAKTCIDGISVYMRILYEYKSGSETAHEPGNPYIATNLDVSPYSPYRLCT